MFGGSHPTRLRGRPNPGGAAARERAELRCHIMDKMEPDCQIELIRECGGPYLCCKM